MQKGILNKLCKVTPIQVRIWGFNMNPFVKELAVLLRIEVPEHVANKELYLQHKIKQRISRLYLDHRSIQREINKLERKTFLTGINFMQVNQK